MRFIISTFTGTTFRLVLLILFIISQRASAHDIHAQVLPLKIWHLKHDPSELKASILYFKDDTVVMETQTHQLMSLPVNAFISSDQILILKREREISALNHSLQSQLPFPERSSAHSIAFTKIALSLLLVIGFSFFIWRLVIKRGDRVVRVIFICGLVVLCFGFTTSMITMVQQATDPVFVDSAFTPFKPAINTFWDANNFYVESQGIPDHEMMTGIVSWQQQVPIPQCYIGANAWSFPLNPVLAATPVPVNQQHFLRGAVAIAVNGVPIFNPYTNTGADAYLTGQLDNFGGHCGRADDYHYHIAPLHLYTQTSPTLPIAFALDGFAIYGAIEPDGTAMSVLDANHGHFWTNGSYHYHGTAVAPYMIGSMVGQVTEDTTLQIVPQPHANPVRPSLTPLTGAVITDCTPYANNNGYVLTYTLSGQTYTVDYSWNSTGQYTYNFISPTGTTTQNYNGFTQCVVPNSTSESYFSTNDISIFPSPARNSIDVELNGNLFGQNIKGMVIYNSNGMVVQQIDGYLRKIDLSTLAKGLYILQVQFANSSFSKKFLIN
jgi:hypothetical protein